MAVGARIGCGMSIDGASPLGKADVGGRVVRRRRATRSAALLVWLSAVLGLCPGVASAVTVFAPAPSPMTGDQPQSVAIGDFNGDGIRDLAVANSSGNVTVLRGNGDGTFTALARRATGDFSDSVAGGGFNPDGKQDRAGVNLTSGHATG